MTLAESLDYLRSLPELKITISGEIGSGKSTFAKRLATELSVDRVYAGGLMREEAQRRGMTLDDFGKLLTTDDKFDREIDELQRQKSSEMKRGIFEGRTAWHFVENPTVKLFFTIDPKQAAERIFKAEDHTRDAYTSVEEIIEANRIRREVEEKRYQTYYGFSAYEPTNFDVIIDTTNDTIDQTFEKGVVAIMALLDEKRSIK